MVRFLKVAATIILSLIVLAGGVLYVLANHSVKETDLTCEGAWGEGGSPETAYVVLTEYRPWIIWTDSDGELQVQTDKLAVFLFAPYVSKIGDNTLAVYRLKESEHGDIIGEYRVANSELVLWFADDLTFKGRCHPRED